MPRPVDELNSSGWLAKLPAQAWLRAVRTAPFPTHTTCIRNGATSSGLMPLRMASPLICKECCGRRKRGGSIAARCAAVTRAGFHPGARRRRRDFARPSGPVCTANWHKFEPAGAVLNSASLAGGSSREGAKDLLRWVGLRKRAGGLPAGDGARVPVSAREIQRAHQAEPRRRVHSLGARLVVLTCGRDESQLR